MPVHDWRNTAPTYDEFRSMMQLAEAAAPTESNPHPNVDVRTHDGVAMHCRLRWWGGGTSPVHRWAGQPDKQGPHYTMGPLEHPIINDATIWRWSDDSKWIEPANRPRFIGHAGLAALQAELNRLQAENTQLQTAGTIDWDPVGVVRRSTFEELLDLLKDRGVHRTVFATLNTWAQASAGRQEPPTREEWAYQYRRTGLGFALFKVLDSGEEFPEIVKTYWDTHGAGLRVFVPSREYLNPKFIKTWWACDKEGNEIPWPAMFHGLNRDAWSFENAPPCAEEDAGYAQAAQEVSQRLKAGV